ncbi:MAG: UbiD family decarboxylase [Betaproteobacteria bacterium]|nr:UbiD family decarboxylase [Betaproteobacteria bacterium]
MTHRTMRDFLSVLEQKGMLRRITRPVDRMWEPAALAKWMYQALPAEKRFGMFFQNVKGSDIPIVTAALGANTAAYAAALDVEVDRINDAWVGACRNPVPPKVVDKALCQEVVITAEDVCLSRLPIPVWTPGKDKGPYITTNIVTRDLDTGIQNMGVYRTMVRDEATVVANLTPGRQGYANMLTWTGKGKVAPIAWVIGAPPAVHLATVAQLPYGLDEITIAGGMMGEPVPVVRCKTSDLLVPADAEIIIEGEILAGEMDLEGPFGEFAGFMGGGVPRPVVHIKAITHRTNPIYYGYTSQMPPSESTTIQSLTNAGVWLKNLRHDLGEIAVTDLFVDLTFGGMLGHAIIAMKPGYPAHAKKVGRLLADMSSIKRVTVVDDDIDIRDHTHVDWAMNARYNPARDTVLIDDVNVPINMDPSLRSDTSQSTRGSKVVCDATLKVDAGTFSLPPKEIMMKALDVWKEIGLPAFEIPKRARLRIEGS